MGTHRLGMLAAERIPASRSVAQLFLNNIPAPNTQTVYESWDRRSGSASEQTDELVLVDDLYGAAFGCESEGFAVFAASA